MTEKSNDVTANYAVQFKAWQKAAGTKPTAEMLHTVNMLGARHGKQCLAIAMSLRPEGVTNSQIIMACGNPQLNKMRGYISDAYLKRLNVAQAENGHTVYKLELTPKGAAKVKRNEAAMAKAAAAGEVVTNDDQPKAKAKKATGKPRKPKAAPASDVTGSDGVASETASIDQPADQPVA